MAVSLSEDKVARVSNTPTIPRYAVWLGRAGRGAIAIAVTGTLLTCFGDGIWFLEGASYWVPSYWALLLAGMAACFPARGYRWIAVGTVCLAVVIALVVPCYMPSPNGAPAGQEPNLRILQANVYEHHGSAAALMALIRETHPDVVLLQEADEEWAKRLLPLAADFPYQSILPRSTSGSGDLGQYWRVESNDPQPLARQGIPGVLTTLHVNGRSITLLNVHPSAPFLPGRAKHHREQVQALTEYLKSVKTPIIVAGDMNSGPWSPLCQTLQHEAHLISVRQGIGILGTWPSFFGPLRCGIDQMFVRGNIQVVQCRVGSGIYSDHRPLITDLYIPPAETATP